MINKPAPGPEYQNDLTNSNGKRSGKRIADLDWRKQESWEPVEIYISERTDSNFSHGLCPECTSKLHGADTLKDMLNDSE